MTTKITDIFGYDLFNGDTFSACCGSTYHSKDTRSIKSYSKGIGLGPGKLSKEVNSEKYTLKHIETKNGPITVCVRKQW